MKRLAILAALMAAALSGATAVFVKTDTTAQGNWIGVYGRDGALIPSLVTTATPYAQMTTSIPVFVWTASTTDIRALQQPGGTGRIASAWYTGSGLINLAISDGTTHRISVYVTDWDAANRSQKIDIVDASTGFNLDTQTLTAYGSGVWVTWDITGSISIRPTVNSGPNAVVMGVFFDPVVYVPPPPPPPPAPVFSRTVLDADQLPMQPQCPVCVPQIDPRDITPITMYNDVPANTIYFNSAKHGMIGPFTRTPGIIADGMFFQYRRRKPTTRDEQCVSGEWWSEPTADSSKVEWFAACLPHPVAAGEFRWQRWMVDQSW